MVHSSGRDSLPNPEDETENRSGVTRWVYRLVALVSALFIITIFILIAVTMSDPTVPANQAMNEWLDKYVAAILGTQVAAIGVLVMFAFFRDRRESWNRYHREYAEWERRMQQLSEQNQTNRQISSDSEPAISPGEAE